MPGRRIHVLIVFSRLCKALFIDTLIEVCVGKVSEALMGATFDSYLHDVILLNAPSFATFEAPPGGAL